MLQAGKLRNHGLIRSKELWTHPTFYLGTGKRKGKRKVRPRTGHEGPEGEYRYSSTLSLTLVLDGGGWLMPHPDRFTPGKETQYPLYRRLGGPQGQSAQVWKTHLHRDSIPGPSSS